MSRQNASVISSLLNTSGSRKANNESETLLFSREEISEIVNFLRLKENYLSSLVKDLTEIWT